MAMLERVDRHCWTELDHRALRSVVLDEVRCEVPFDAHVCLLLDPETMVGWSPLAGVSLPDGLPSLVRGRYLARSQRWTDVPVAEARSLAPLAGGAPGGDDPWRELLVGAGVDDVAKVVLGDPFGRWRFLDLWRVGGTFSAAGGRSLGGVYRFLLKPRWILSHVLVLALVVVLVNLGLWQLHRLDQKRDFNALVESRTELPAEPVADVLPASAGFDDADAVVYRTVTAEGTYVPDEEVIVRSRTYQSESGAWLLTPLRLDDGTAVLVNRGWVPIQAGLERQPDWAPPTGTVRVEGLLVATQVRGRFGATDPEGERLETVARADVARLQEQVDEDLIPAVLQLDTQEPGQPGDFPVAIGPPELSEGPHLNYAGQWFIFAAIAAVGYPLMLRRIAHSRAKEAAAAERAAAGGGPDDEAADPSSNGSAAAVTKPLDAPA